MFSEIVGFIGNRLHSLHIQSPFAAFLSSVRFECLHAFSIDAIGWHHTNDVHDIMVLEVPTFLLAHESTVRNVSFSIEKPTLQLSPILYCLQGMFGLTDISLSLPYATTMAPFEGQNEILTHQHNLKSLSLNVFSVAPVNSSDPTEFTFFFQGWWFPVNVPNLKKLAIRIPRSFFSKDLSTYLQRFSFSLVSLEFTLEPYCQHPEITDLCKMVADLASLQEFSLNVYQFSPQVLSVFARTLPDLRSLHLDYSYISQYKDPRIAIVGQDRANSVSWFSFVTTQESLTPSVQFDGDMKPYANEFSNWQLESLDYTSRNYTPNEWIDGIVASFLPNVLWVRQQPRHLRVQTWLSHQELQTTSQSPDPQSPAPSPSSSSL